MSLPGRSDAQPSWLLPALILAAYLALRLPGLMGIPLFNDEAVYLVRAARFPAELPTTLSDGKLIQELALAALAPLPVDPLLPARLLSVACGALTLAGIVWSGRALGSPAAGLLGALLYAAAPLPVLHDRLGLPDSMLACVSSLLVLGGARYAGGARAGRREAALLGLLLGAAALVKLPGLFLMGTPVLAVLTLQPQPAERRQRLAQLRTALLVALALVAALAPFHYGGAERGKLGSLALDARLALMWTYAGQMSAWLVRYLPAPLLLLCAAALADRRTPDSDRRSVAFLVCAGLALHLAFLVLGSAAASRYLLPAWPPLLLAAAVGAVALWRAGLPRGWRRPLVGAALGASLAWGAAFGAQLGRDPLRAALDPSDRLQYLETWTAGHNLGELLADVSALGAGGGVLVANHDQPRLIHLAATLYLRHAPGVRLATVDLAADDALAQLRAAGAGGTVVVPLDEQERLAFDVERRLPELALRRAVTSPGGSMRFYLYELRPEVSP